MKAKQLYEKLIENWKIKAGCFAIALFLYVVYQTQSIDKRVFSVPLTVEAKNGFVAVESQPRTVAVTARGKSEELAQVRDTDLKAYLDLNYVSKDGSYDFPILLTLSDTASILNPLELKVSPESVKLRVEEEITSFADIVPLISGNPGYGCSIKSISVVPDQIAIRGPRSMVENCKSLKTLSVTASGAKRSFSAKTKVEQKGLFIKHADTEVNVTVEIEELEGSRQFTKLPVKIENLSPELEISTITDDIMVTLKGSMVLLEAFVPEENFVFADVSSINAAGTFDIPIQYNVPKGFELGEGYTKTIPVTFVQKQKPGTEAVEEKITVLESSGGILEEKVER